MCDFLKKVKIFIFGEFRITSHCSVSRARSGQEQGGGELVNFQALVRQSSELQSPEFDNQSVPALHVIVRYAATLRWVFDRHQQPGGLVRSYLSVSHQITALLPSDHMEYF